MRIGTASVRRRAQLLALEPTLSIEPLRGNIDTRLRKRGERGLDAIVLAACGLDRLGLAGEIGHRFEPERAAAGGRPGRARAAGARRRGGARRPPPTIPRRAGAVEPSGAAWPSIGGGCLAPVAAHHDGATLTALVAAEDGALGRAAQRRRPEARSRRELLAAIAVRIVVTRPGGPLGRRWLGAARGARARGRALPARSRSSRSATSRSTSPALRLGRRHEPERRRASCCAARAAGCPAVAAIGPGTADCARRAGIRRTLVPRVSTQEGLLAELPRPAGRVLFAGAEGARRLLVDELGADFVPLYRTRRAHGRSRPPARRPRRARLGVGGARVRARSALGDPGRLDRPADDRGGTRGAASTSSPRPRRTTSTASSPRWRRRPVNLQPA